jgi:hypothetical protein
MRLLGEVIPSPFLIKSYFMPNADHLQNPGMSPQGS